ncbi:MAG: SWIM zinc finger domain-containing protein [Bdellovibrio sp.]|jgi:hypothetical protein
MSLAAWEHFFKPEVRSSGRAFVAKGKVALSRPSDTEIQGYIRTSSPFKVVFKSESIDNPLLTASCSCPQSKKGQLCKHMWAALLVIDDKNTDFLEGKVELQNESVGTAAAAPKKPKQSEAQIASQAAYSLKQAEYRKQQYQKQKERAKSLKRTKKGDAQECEHPPEVDEALAFFESNGFSFKDSFNPESVAFAMKKLARVFHPDLGGSHEEILELNKFSGVLEKYFSKHGTR